jgi:hypothetical protein
VEKHLANILFKNEPVGASEDTQEFLLMNRLETFRAGVGESAPADLADQDEPV